ncbi:hypothetical protein LINGRAHAP2_LOCUS4217 [Linum grandiflorum]
MTRINRKMIQFFFK